MRKTRRSQKKAESRSSFERAEERERCELPRRGVCIRKAGFPEGGSRFGGLRLLCWDILPHGSVGGCEVGLVWEEGIDLWLDVENICWDMG